MESLVKASPAIATLMVLIFGFLLHQSKTVKEKLAEKDVQIFYDALDSYFLYVDSVNLFLNLSETFFSNHAIKKIALPGFFSEQYATSYQDFFVNIRGIKKAIFLAKVLEEGGLSKELSEYFESSTRIAKDIFDVSEGDLTTLKEIDVQLVEERLEALQCSMQKLRSLEEKIVYLFAQAKNNL